MYAVILNFETGRVEALDLRNMPEGEFAETYIEETLKYSLSNCEWMTFDELPEIELIN